MLRYVGKTLVVYACALAVLSNQAAASDQSTGLGSESIGVYLAAAKDASPRPKKISKPGTAMMVLGIVFTPIFGVALVGSAALYSDAKAYDCDGPRKRGAEEDPARGELLKDDRMRCYKSKKDYLRSATLLIGISAAGVGFSIMGIVAGARKRSGASSSEAATVNLKIDEHLNPIVVWNMPLSF